MRHITAKRHSKSWMDERPKSAKIAQGTTELGMHCENPPLVEVACGVSFLGVKWTPVHFGLYYQNIRERHPVARSAAPIIASEPGHALVLQMGGEPTSLRMI